MRWSRIPSISTTCDSSLDRIYLGVEREREQERGKEREHLFQLLSFDIASDYKHTDKKAKSIN